MVCLNLTKKFPLCLLLAHILSIFTVQGQGPPNLNAENIVADSSERDNFQSELNAELCKNCYGRSKCINNNGAIECFCQPDYYGKFCDMPSQKLLEECTKPQCTNGGICKRGSGGSFCVCPANYVGINCSRVAVWIEVQMNLYMYGLPMGWDAVNKTEPAISDAACNKLITSNLLGSDPVIATSIVDCNLQRFEKVQIDETDGMRVNVLLKYDPGYNESKFAASDVRRQLELAPPSVNSVGADFTMDKTIEITNFDVCKSNMHDCSPSAICISEGFHYTCQCKKFYTEGGVRGEILPGRICYRSFISGFVLGCLIIVPILIAALVALFYVRRYRAQKAWISASSGPLDSMQLFSAERPKYGA